MYRSEVKHNPKTPKGAKFNVLQNSFLIFLIVLVFDTQNQIFDFSKFLTYRTENLGVITNGI